MTENRRRHPRVRAQGIVAHLRGPTGRHPCQVENISIGGLFVRTDQVLDVGTQLEVDLVRPGWKRGLSFFVRVTSRIDPLAGRFARITPGMGLQFFGKMDETQRERLLTLLRELGAPEPAPESVSFGPGEMELPPLELDDGMPFETETPLWQQVSMVEEANDAAPLDAESFPSRAPAPRATPPTAALQRQAPRAAPPPAAGAPSLSSVPQPSGVASSPSYPSRPAPPTVAPTAEARLMLQIRGLLMEVSHAQQILARRDLEIEQLKEELEAARAQLAAAQRE